MVKSTATVSLVMSETLYLIFVKKSASHMNNSIIKSHLVNVGQDMWEIKIIKYAIHVVQNWIKFITIIQNYVNACLAFNLINLDNVLHALQRAIITIKMTPAIVFIIFTGVIQMGHA